ncbi:Cyclin PHO80-like [Trypanosoma melophagium]|uniref:Cyclin PHO80-like n=1 Tax=Trypanosoma melophagium TaxID=715481 RepID=UPI00351AA01A|nr:Cyclin PHO80-like [Trypanosoma melophagium]
MHMLAQLMAMALQQRCSEQRELESLHQTSFHSSRVPHISLRDYVSRIAKYSGCSPECFVLMIIYIDRYVAATNCPITFRNIHRLTITAATVSAKLKDDIYYSNAYYASIGGITNTELNRLELEFLKTIDWYTWVEPVDYYTYCEQLQSRYMNSACVLPSETLGVATTGGNELEG